MSYKSFLSIFIIVIIVLVILFPDKIWAGAEKGIFSPGIGPLLRKTIEESRVSGRTAVDRSTEESIFNSGLIKVIVVMDRDHLSQLSKNLINELKKRIEQFGGHIGNHAFNNVQVWIPVEKIEELAEWSEIKFIKKPLKPQLNRIVSEGNAVIGTTVWNNLGLTGKGVKIGVIDFGFKGYADLLGTELPSSVTTKATGFYSEFFSSKHGTACAEIVHDTAPGADLFLVDVTDMDVDFHKAVSWLSSQDVDIVSSSIGINYNLYCKLIYESLSGSISDYIVALSQIEFIKELKEQWDFTINDAVSQGITWAQAAGNNGKRRWFDNFEDSDGDDYLNFSSYENYNEIELPSYFQYGSDVYVLLEWNSGENSSSADDFDLYITDGFENTVASSIIRQSSFSSLTLEACKFIPEKDKRYFVKVHKYQASPQLINLTIGTDDFPEFKFNSPGGTVSLVPPAHNPNVITVGAVPYDSPHIIESYSSQGPNADGVIKPDLVAPDYVSTASYDSFRGTSAATPHVAGICAIVKQVYPDYSPAQIQNYIEANATDLGIPGKDNVYGSGLVQLPASQVYQWFSKNPDDLKPLAGTTWEFTYSIISIELIYTISIETDISTTSDGHVKLNCSDEFNRTGAVFFIEYPFSAGGDSTFIAVIKGSTINIYFFFKTDDHTATGYCKYRYSDGSFSNEYSMTGIKIKRSEIPDAERDALINLYNSTDGENWKNNRGWPMMSGTECSWYGVACDGEKKHVTELNLTSNDLSGAIPRELENLANLTMLGIGDNGLTGNIPPELGNLLNLQELYLWENQLTGNIPAELGNLVNLTKLYLSNNQLTGDIPRELGNLASLTYLTLTRNELSGAIPRELGNLANLAILALGGNGLTGNIPPELGNLLNLQELYLWENQLGGNIPAELGNLVNLTILYLSDNQLTGAIPKELGNLANLTVLALGGNELTGAIPPELGNLLNLQELYLWENQLTGNIPAELGNLVNLTKLSLRDNQLTGTIPRELGNLANLEYLYLNNNQLTGAIPAEFMNLTNLLYRKSDFRFNFLHTSDPDLRSFLNSRQIGGDWESTQNIKVNGSVLDKSGTLLCAMVLANGQYAFSCENMGKYELKVPLNENREIVLFGFCDGFQPFKQILTPGESINFDIIMSPASPDSSEMSLTHQFDTATTNPDWVKISGTVRYEDIPLCAMVLANGQHIFSCADVGEYDLEVPLNDDGQIILFGFADGFQPFRQVLEP